MLGWREIESLREAGMRFECHTHSHPDLTAVGRDVMAAECERADRIIESRLGRRPAYFAYPYGRLTAVASDYARRRYRASVTTVLGALAGGEDPAALPRIDTYYLRSRWIHQRLDSPVSQAWLTLRAVLRRIRGST
jgi:peptidoglycan/xylan/chitin deacetylase (PgdA/CDA1 family)